MLNRLSGASLRVRVGLGVALLSGGVSSMVFGWGYVTTFIALMLGVYAAYVTPPITGTTDQP